MKKETNLEKGKKSVLNKLTDYVPESIVSRMLIKNDSGNITLFAFAKGQGLAKHSAPFDAFVNVIEGEGIITIGETEHDLKTGEVIIMPANIPHSVQAKENFKMLLVMIRG